LKFDLEQLLAEFEKLDSEELAEFKAIFKEPNLQALLKSSALNLTAVYMARRSLKRSFSAALKLRAGEMPSRREISSIVGGAGWLAYLVAGNANMSLEINRASRAAQKRLAKIRQMVEPAVKTPGAGKKFNLDGILPDFDPEDEELLNRLLQDDDFRSNFGL